MSASIRTPRVLLLAGLGLAAACALAAGAGDDAIAAKKKAKNKVVTFQNATQLAVPDRPAGVNTLIGSAESTIQVAGKALKGKEIADVDVSVAATHPELEDLEFLLIAPGGMAIFLAGDNDGIGGNATNYGAGTGCGATMTTFSDETQNFISNTDTALGPGAILSPWATTVQAEGYALKNLDGGPVTGTWTLEVSDDTNGDTGTLSCWKLRIKPRNALK